VKEKTKERLFAGLTTIRLAQGIDYARRVKAGRSVVGATIGIIAVDLLDGIAARKLGVDGPARRAADSATDGGIIAAGLISTFQKHPEARGYAVALAAREIFVGAGWAIDLATSKKVKKGDDFHKLPSLAVAAFGLAAHHGSERTMRNTGRAAVAVNAALAYDYLKGWTDPRRTRTLDTGVTEIAGFYDARKMLHDIRNAPPQLEAGTPSVPQLEQGEVVELREFTGEGELPPGTFKAAPEDG
jgi:hypothetical protein